ncbi:unnamed protein product [Blepharisma stoltei]|uniref:Uncharacterized protein n=1 Tax=Blepharisma stoltei TaxID=1481888 RepID=A0AAU9J9E1_9CILI|nr:unnamed protein product [Blepharisma stoltei]
MKEILYLSNYLRKWLIYCNIICDMSSIALKLPIFSVLEDFIMLLGRNKRWPTKSNHGSRPNSHIVRQLKKKAYHTRQSDPKSTA